MLFRSILIMGRSRQFRQRQWQRSTARKISSNPTESFTKSAVMCWWKALAERGWDIPSPRASMFAWAPLPPALAHLGSLEFSKQLLTHAGVAVAAGVGYGEEGEGFVRIAMVENEQRLRQAARNVKKYLVSMGVNTGNQGAA